MAWRTRSLWMEPFSMWRASRPAMRRTPKSTRTARVPWPPGEWPPACSGRRTSSSCRPVVPRRVVENRETGPPTLSQRGGHGAHASHSLHSSCAFPSPSRGRSKIPREQLRYFLRWESILLQEDLPNRLLFPEGCRSDCGSPIVADPGHERGDQGEAPLDPVGAAFRIGRDSKQAALSKRPQAFVSRSRESRSRAR